MQFEWTDFYMELADKLMAFRNDRKSLIEKIKDIYTAINIKLPTLEKDNDIVDIDPFTVYGLFNKGIKNANRMLIMNQVAEEFGINAKVPTNFDGIPVLNNMSATFYGFKDNRGIHDIDNLWNLFQAALKLDKELNNERYKKDFINYYNLVKGQYGGKWKITMGLYWIRPYTFINLDSVNRSFITQMGNLPEDYVVLAKNILSKDEIPSGEAYLDICIDCMRCLKTGRYKYTSFPELSYYAWIEPGDVENKKVKDKKKKEKSNAEFLKWFAPIIRALRELGGSATAADTRNKIIENEHLTQEQVSVTRGKTKVNKFENEVAFARNYLVKSGYIDNGVRGIWTLTEAGKKVDMTDELASEIFKTVVAQKFYDTDLEFADEEKREYKVYTERNFLEDVYMSAENYSTLVSLLRHKKNIILQGAPGVGKTFAAKLLAYSMMGERNSDRVMLVQFHQSYSYEDFVEGYRPNAEGAGFVLTKGVFYNFCKKAEVDRDNEYFFIIDEINRGNLSKIFGELFMLVEKDKRNQNLQLLYSRDKFNVPENVYIIGMMNTADRSLAMIDYALRRRFSFFELKPGFETEGFRKYRMKLHNSKFDKLIQCTEELNLSIINDETLGEGFCIGHSYFCDINPEELDDERLMEIVEFELIPLLREYWFDEPKNVEHWSEKLRGAIR